MTCREVMDVLYDYLDEELTPDRASAVRLHLKACHHCLGLSRFEDAFLRFVEVRTRARRAPKTLHRQILERLLLEPPGHPSQTA